VITKILADASGQTGGQRMQGSMQERNPQF
jgi:hypothetical protein